MRPRTPSRAGIAGIPGPFALLGAPCPARAFGQASGAVLAARHAVFYDAHAPPSRAAHPAPSLA